MIASANEIVVLHSVLLLPPGEEIRCVFEDI